MVSNPSWEALTMEGFRSFPVVYATLLSWLGYLFALGIYRLYLSPLAKYPGPKLAALTQWYEIYYDVFRKGGGQFTFEIKRMHEKYGPIVRINPDELHIDDPEQYDIIYATSKLYDKMDFFSYRLNMPFSSFGTAEADKHKIRRGAIAPFYTRNKIRSHNALFQKLMDRISHRLSSEYAGTGRVVDLVQMWGCMTSDAICEVVFAIEKNYVNAPDFRADFTTAVCNMVFAGHILTHFGFIVTMMNLLPQWLVKKAAPAMKPVIEWEEAMEQQIKDVLAGRSEKSASHENLFHDILQGNLPPEELRVDRLRHEAMSMVAAGIETTKWALSVASCHILSNPDVEKHLRAELEAAIPDSTQMPSWGELERLPYLSAVIQESLRLSFGLVQRLPRVNNFSVWQYGEYTIAPGTPVGMDSFHMHSNEKIFPDWKTFKPERWLGNPKGPDGDKPLSHYMVAFSKGSRMCIGMNMAQAELYIGLATLFRRHRLELYETDVTDVEFALDMITPQPRLNSKGVRVIVKE